MTSGGILLTALWIVFGVISFLLIAISAAVIFMLCSFLLRRRRPKISPKVFMPQKEELDAAYARLKEEGLECHHCESAGRKLYAEFIDKGTDRAAVLMHGLQGCGAHRAIDAQYYLDRGYSVLLPDFRACGGSDGRFCGMGMFEREDIPVWTELLKARLGADCRIVLDGVSMGAASALLIAGDGQCPNVRAVIADAPYSSFKEMCRTIAAARKLPPFLFSALYPFQRFWGYVLLGKDLDKAAPIALMESMQVPVLFLHGEADDFVPCDMSREMAEHCAAPATLFTLPDVPHVGMRALHRAECEAKMDEFLSEIM